MHIYDMTKKDFLNLPLLEPGEIDCESIVIVPLNRKHETGFGLFGVAVVDENGEALGFATKISDVIQLGGSGGYGYNWYEEYGGTPKAVVPSFWRMELMPKSQLVHLWTGNKIKTGRPKDSFDIYDIPEKKS